MEERLIRLPYVEVQNGNVNGAASDIEHQGICIAHEDNVFALRIIRPDLNGHFVFDSYYPIEAESIINEDLAHREHDFEDLKNQIRIKDEKIKDLNIQYEEITKVNKSLSDECESFEKQNAELKEQLAIPKRNGSCEWVSGKTLIDIVKELTKK